MNEPNKAERIAESETDSPEADKPKIYRNAVDYVLNVPIETDEDLASLGQIYTD